ncbi:AMP-binding protein [Alkalihalobacterium elongatum]|uniref:AMP-binding protein n=1 Tax=Alkalihalobacterium elongatum TaxID=2675466 RepID=UPI001C1FCCCB|nr:AMP-binding protein [Alkalihalobacterium elongatum]
MRVRDLDKSQTALYFENGYWKNKVTSDYVQKCALEFPYKIAVVDGQRSATFKEIEELSIKCATGLYRYGIRKGDVVSFQLPNILEAVILYHGITRLGAVANPIVPIYRGKELRFILNQAKSKLVFIPGKYRGHDYPEMYQEISSELPHLEKIIIVNEEKETAFLTFNEFLYSDVNIDENIQEYSLPTGDDIVLLLYTSGTTSNPKGALHSHNTLLYDVDYLTKWFRLNERDCIFNPSPISHITGILCALNIPFLIGCTVVLQDKWDPDQAIKNISDNKCSFMIFATPFLQGILSSPLRSLYDLRSIRYICCGGADMNPLFIKKASEELGCTVVRQYGATELPSATCTNIEDSPDKRYSSDGRWMSPTEGRIVNENNEICNPGEVGEVQWRGPEMFLGYLDQSLNEDSFTKDGWFKTGDLAKSDEDGYIYITGRKKDIINRGGEKISAKEVEDVLLEHPKVKEIAIVGIPDPVMVERACAFVVCEEQNVITFEEMTQFLNTKELAKQKYPEYLEIITELPKTASGKIQKFVLKQGVENLN